MITEKLERNKLINARIIELNNEIKVLKNEKKKNKVFIFENCKHNWVLAPEYFQYDERPNKCTKCNLVRN